MSALRIRPSSSDKAIADVESITIRMENGKLLSFELAKELAVSSNPAVMAKQALTAHARFAFWEYQAARAMREVREREIALGKLEGERSYGYARALKDEDRYVSSDTIAGAVASDPEVIKARNQLNKLREHWSILKSTANALDHRAHLLRRLLAREQDAQKS